MEGRDEAERARGTKDAGTCERERERGGPSFPFVGRAAAYRRRQKNQATKRNAGTAEYCIHRVCHRLVASSRRWQTSLQSASRMKARVRRKVGRASGGPVR
jgi:hypothetical protein